MKELEFQLARSNSLVPEKQGSFNRVHVRPKFDKSFRSDKFSRSYVPVKDKSDENPIFGVNFLSSSLIRKTSLSQYSGKKKDGQGHVATALY